MDFSKARQPHAKALRGIEELKKAKTFAEYEEIYQDVLHDIQRIYNKVMNIMKGHPKESSLLGKYRHDRDSDELLAYIKAARNSDEHTIADIARHEPGFTGFKAAPGSRGLYIDRLEITSGGGMPTSIMFKGSPAEITIKPPRVVPLPVKDRGGKVYQPPKIHLGNGIEGLPLTVWLKLCLNYYGAMLTDLEKNA